MFDSCIKTLLINLTTGFILVTLVKVQGQFEFDHDDSEDMENRRAIRLADEEYPANGPFALKDASLPENGAVEQRWINQNWFILQKRMSWGEAIVACENAEAHLIVLPTVGRAKQLVNSIAMNITEKYEKIFEYERKYRSVEFGPDRRYWIGLTDQIKEGQWTWVRFGLELLYDFWYPGQPDHQRNNRGNLEHCVSLWNPGYYQTEDINTHRFNDEPCTNQYYPICGAEDPLDEYHKAYFPETTERIIQSSSQNQTHKNSSTESH